jgi:hypothetical protein
MKYHFVKKNIGWDLLCRHVQTYCMSLKIAILFSPRIIKRILGKIA